MTKTKLMDLFGDIFLEMLEDYALEYDDLIQGGVLDKLVEAGMSTRQIKAMGIFDPKDIKRAKEDYKKGLLNKVKAI